VIKLGILTTDKLEHTGAMIYSTLRSGETELDISKLKRDMLQHQLVLHLPGGKCSPWEHCPLQAYLYLA